MISFSRIPLQVVKDSFHLIEDHWNEVAKDERKLKPHWIVFDELETQGRLSCFAAKNDDEIVGYTVFLLQQDLHAADTTIAFNDAVFLKKEFRRNNIGPQFMQYCEDELKKQQVNLVIWHVKPAVDYSGTLKRMGYKIFSTLYAKQV